MTCRERRENEGNYARKATAARTPATVAKTEMRIAAAPLLSPDAPAVADAPADAPEREAVDPAEPVALAVPVAVAPELAALETAVAAAAYSSADW